MIKAISPLDVEHFRPKAAVQECPSHRGYWWLAAVWENLLASCPDCNRKRHHTDFAAGLTLDQLNARGQVLLGKSDSFPLIDNVNNRYVHTEDDVFEEEPALIDPTLRSPEQHLAWSVAGEWALISPKSIDGNFDPHGYASIYTYGLNRRGLVEARTSLLLRMKGDVVKVERLIELSAQADASLSNTLRTLAMENFRSLYQWAEPDQPYSMMVKAYLDQTNERLISEYALLLDQITSSGDDDAVEA